jgi:amidophosphoribosyltransferase
MASESVALKQLGFDDIIDITPGQAVFIPKGGVPEFRQIVEKKAYTPDAFEYVYFARPDSTLEGISVYRSRQNMGEKLAKKVRDILGDKGVEEIDAVIPVPETSNIAAATLANKLGKPYVTALIKNRFVGRTFILPNQALRQKSVRRKLSPIESEFRGKNLIIVDDSLVRGTTSREIVQMARASGAKRVVFVSCSPACTHPHIYGIDLADPADLIARGKTWPEIAKHIDADEVIFQDLEDLKSACQEASEGPSHVEGFEVGVFCGKYVTDVPENYFEHLNDLRRGTRDKSNGLTVVKPGGDERTVVSSSGPTNGPPSGPEADALRNANGIKTPEIREDIRCVLFDRDDASCLSANLSAQPIQHC